MQEHSTKVFKQICEALNQFVTSMLTRESVQSSGSSSGGNLSPTSAPASPLSEKSPTQSGFLYRGVWIPVPNLSQTNLKPI